MKIKTDLSTYNNDWYQPAGTLKRFLWHYVCLWFFKSGIFPYYPFKRSLLRIFGAKLGKGVVLKPHINIKYPWLLEIGDHAWIGEHVWIDNLAMVSIGNNVCISQDALLLCGNHDYTKTTFDLQVSPIILEEGVWIGARAIVCGGVTCRSHAVLSVASVATTSLDAYTIYKGNPAEKIKERVMGGK